MRSGINALTGRKLLGRDHIRQSIADILSTPLGSRVMRRDYGSLLPELVDQPLHGATLLRVMAASVDAILRWEPDVQMQSIQISSTADGYLVVDFNAAEITGGSERLTVPIALRGVVA